MMHISFLLPFSKRNNAEKRPWANPGVRNITEGFDVDFEWMSVIFQRGFTHDIVQVRRMIFRSFLELDWEQAPKVKATYILYVVMHTYYMWYNFSSHIRVLKFYYFRICLCFRAQLVQQQIKICR